MDPTLPPSSDRLSVLRGFLRSLLRRSGARCELCEETVKDLAPWEAPPAAVAPELSRTVLLCPRCRAGLADPAADLGGWVFLQGSAWSDVPVVQVTAVRALSRAAGAGASWAKETLEGLYLPPDVEAWLDLPEADQSRT
jgi:protein PhnA